MKLYLYYIIGVLSLISGKALAQDVQSYAGSKGNGIRYFHYAYPDAPAEDCVVELTYLGDTVVEGCFWGTSDEFSSGREGYYPGFFVLPMQNVTQRGDSLFFTLDSYGTQFFSNAVSVSFHSAREAAACGLHPWLQESRFFYARVPYKACFKDGKLFIDNTAFPYLDAHSFRPVSRDAALQLNRSLPSDEERANRKNR